METSRNERRNVVEDYYKSMSDLKSMSITTFLCHAKDKESTLRCAKDSIIQKLDAVHSSKLAECLYEWLENEYNQCLDPGYENIYALENFITVMNRILFLQLLWIQYSMCIRSRVISLNEYHFFISYANNAIYKYQIKKHLPIHLPLLYPIEFFEEVYEEAQNGIKDIQPDQLEEYYKLYIQKNTYANL